MTSLTQDLRLSVQHTTCQLAFKEAEGPYAPSLHTRPLIVQRSAVWVGACAQMQEAPYLTRPGTLGWPVCANVTPMVGAHEQSDAWAMLLWARSCSKPSVQPLQTCKYLT